MEYPPFYNPEYETLERSELEALQLKRLKETVVHCMQSPFYKKRFAENKLTPDSIAVLIYDPEHDREKSLLPKFEPYRVWREFAFSMKAVRFYPIDGMVRFLLIEEEVSILQTGNYVLIDAPYPSADGNRTVFNLLIVRVYVVIRRFTHSVSVRIRSKPHNQSIF